MGDPLTLTNARDAHVAEAHPSLNQSKSARLYLAASGSSNTRYAYVLFGRPFPLTVDMISSKFRIWNGVALSGSVTVTIERITAQWSVTKVNWNNKPGITTTNSVSVTKTGAAAGTMWEFDVNAMMQQVSDGAPWYGFRIRISTTAGGWFHSANAVNDNYQPQLELTWSDAPEAPEELKPDGGRAVSVAKPVLSFDFTDVSGNTQIGRVHVQIDPTGDWAGGDLWDSGWVTVDSAELDLATTTYPGLAEGATTFWRVQVEDGAGVQSSWSDSAGFMRTSFGTLSVGNPPSGTPVVKDTTPEIFWTYTPSGGGGAQRAYEVLLVTPDEPSRAIWDSGKTSAGDTAIVIPARQIKDTTQTYRILVRVWDMAVRQAEGGRPTYVEVSRDFTYSGDGAVVKVTSLTAAQAFPWPWMQLTWNRTTAPDFYTILRDNEPIDENLDPADLFVSGTQYTYRDRLTTPRVNHTWEVVSKVNGVASGGNPTVVAMTKPSWSWLMRLDSSDPIALLRAGDEKDPVVDPSLTEMQEMHQPVGGDNPVLITQFLNGYEGHVSARLADDVIPGVTARDMRNRYKGFIKDRGKRLLLFWVDETMTIIPYNMTYRPKAMGGGKVVYDIEFDFFEVD